jgi:uncharacterized protein
MTFAIPEVNASHSPDLGATHRHDYPILRNPPCCARQSLPIDSGKRAVSARPALKEKSRVEPEDLIKLVTRRMPFGKYEGRLVADLPGPYLNWFAREGFPPGEIGELLHLMHEIDHNGLGALLEPLRR